MQIQSVFVVAIVCAMMALVPVTEEAESCVPVTGGCTIGSLAAPCCPPSVCTTNPITGMAYCIGPPYAVACWPTGHSCIANAYPYCCPQQACNGNGTCH